MRKFFIITFSLLSGVSLISAQEKSAKDTLNYQLEQVTVSATRYPEKVMEVPYAVSIIPQKKLELLRGFGLDEILNTVPGVLAK